MPMGEQFITYLIIFFIALAEIIAFFFLYKFYCLIHLFETGFRLYKIRYKYIVNNDKKFLFFKKKEINKKQGYYLPKERVKVSYFWVQRNTLRYLNDKVRNDNFFSCYNLFGDKINMRYYDIIQVSEINNKFLLLIYSYKNS